MISQKEFEINLELEVFPQLRKIEQNRRQKVFFWRTKMILLGGFLLMFGLFLFQKGYGVIICELAIAPYLFGIYQLQRYQKRVKQNLCQKVFSLLEMVSCLPKKIPVESLEYLEDKKLLPFYNMASFDDCFHLPKSVGEIYVQEAKLIKKTFKVSSVLRRKIERNETGLVFWGPVVQLSVDKPYTYPILLKSFDKERGGEGIFFKTKQQKIVLEDVDFNQKYVVFSEDQIYARKILTPTFMERLKLMEEVFQAPVNILFEEKKIIIALNINRDMFEFFNVYKSTFDKKDFIRFYHEIQSLQKFAKLLNLEEKSGDKN